MILDELVMRNVGTFEGRNVISLAPPEVGRPIVLIGGLNGCGKTTILDAIHLALYGALAQASGRRSGSYENYLTSLIHHGVQPREGAAVELAFRASQQGTERRYRVCRTWRSTGAAVRESLYVEVDGRSDQTLTSIWNEHIEAFLPRGIAGLFFFDGEQIEALADLECSRQVLGSALAALLGLDLVQRLTTDLSVLRRRHRVSQVPESLRNEVEERQRAVTAIRQVEEQARMAEAVAQNELERAEKKLFEVTEQYRSAGGDLVDQRQAANSKAAMIRAELERTECELRDEMAGAAPILLAAGLLPGLASQARDEAFAATQRIVLNTIAERDEAIIGQLRNGQVPRQAISAVEEYLAADRDRRQSSSRVPVITALSQPEATEFLLSRTLPAIQSRVCALVSRRASLLADLEAAERFLAAIPTPESLAGLCGQRDTAASELTATQASLVRAQDQVASLGRERARADAAYEAAMDRAAQASLAADDDRRIVDHIDRVGVTLEALRAAATRRHLASIGEFVLEALSRLLRKQSLITNVEIDPDSHTVELSGKDGRSLAAQDLSAGERQLLAVALLWGLARASGQPLPVVIDTPLGRLDGSHRGHLLDRYFPYASHQVILLSTDTEIDQDAYRRLRPSVGRSYRLQFDQSADATTVQPGYFWE